MKLAIYYMSGKLLKRFSRSEVKVQLSFTILLLSLMTYSRFIRWVLGDCAKMLQETHQKMRQRT